MILQTGSLYLSKVAAHDEQALVGGIFNSVAQVGASLGLAVVTIVQTSAANRKATKLGVDLNYDRVRAISVLNYASC